MEELKEGWRRVKLSEVVDFNPENLKNNNKLEFINYLDTANITEGRIDEIKKMYPNGEKIPSRAKRIVQINDVIYSSVRPNLKHYGILKKVEKNLIASTGFIVLRAKHLKISPDYLYNFLRLEKNIEFVSGIAETSTTTYPSITSKVLEDLEIDLPPLETQEKIASILSALDDKIEINNEMNKTLEEMAQTLFKRWFIDFDFPNENGEPYRSSGGKMVDSELGEIPEGWEVEELGKISTLSAGGDKPQSFSKIQTSDYTIPIYSNGVENEGLYGFTNEAKIFEKGVTVSARGTIGYICLRQVPYVPIVRLVSIVPNVNILSSEYLYYYLKKVEIHSTGTTQQQLTVPQFKRTKILIPNFEVLKIFTEKVESMINLLEKNKSENKNISLIRDTLLPKLMSGEIEV